MMKTNRRLKIRFSQSSNWKINKTLNWIKRLNLVYLCSTDGAHDKKETFQHESTLLVTYFVVIHAIF